ncbi:NfeD family protein [Xylophilus ampelinus]|uniref:Membrane protein implicated in regulation of membrane protease activity n=1 Tax=Xylophilus ampelinus TaxID=54067 RepID=A0A318SUX7_9BURK|nr:NfeD family protein [Xylophilus ampelinus]MCS4511589.1 NfeD family protein [Xylophilus ampelinus]PYE74239.1 membrane protein implicated in regulation of membrane protease activity [Xylophilus ampelinus]
MALSTYWWLLAGAAIAAEMLSGTVYLLLIGGGFAAAAVAAHMGTSLPLQIVVAAAIGAGAVLVWRFLTRRAPSGPAASADPDVNLDIGETVQVVQWEPDGTAHVHYRGARWTVVPRPGALPGSTGAHRVVEVVGTRLVVDKI